jgi:hypothetical protein
MYKAGLLSLLLLLLAGTARAQVSTASVNGVVRDSAGAVVPGVTIVLQNLDTSVQHPSVSNGSGAYVILNIPPGRYTIQASAKGFNPQKTSEFVLVVDQNATFDFAMTVGSQTEVVTVDATAAQMDVTSASLGTVIETKQVNELPLNGRNFTSLLSLTPGVVPIMVGQNSGMNGRNGNGGFGAAVALGGDYTFPAINGQTGRSNFFLMDGLYNYGSIESTYAVAPIIDAIQEFKVVSHTDSAEFGGVLGGVVNVVTKSGTNDLHGAAWEYIRNTAFDANCYFTATCTPKPFYHQNQFGASGGGPVVIPKLYNGRNKTFFFGAYQGYRYSTPSDNPLLVPTDAELAGNEADNQQLQAYNPFTTTCVATPGNPCGTFSRTAFEGNQIPSNLINPQMVAWAKFVYPEAGPCINLLPNGACAANYLDTTPTTQVQNEFNVRGDQNFGAKDSAWFRYSFINSTVSKSGGLPGLPYHRIIQARDWGGNYVHIFSPTRIAQVQFARATVLDNTSSRFAASTADILSTVGFSSSFVSGFAAAGGGSLLTGPNPSGYASGGESISDTPKATDTDELRGTLTEIRGSHEIKFGVGFDTANFASPLAQIGMGFGSTQTADPELSQATGDSLTSFLLDVPNSGASRRNVNEQERPGGLLSAFLQDSWKATRKLTVNYGLRYDYPFLPRYGTNATVGQNGGPETGDMDWSSGNFIVQQLPPLCSVRGFAPCIPGDGLPAHVIVSQNGKITHNVHTNYGPRLGFAYKVDEKTVVHGAFGIVFDDWAAVTQMAQNFEGFWPDIGQQIAGSLTNIPQAPTASNPQGQLLPNVTAQNPFAGAGNANFPPATPFNNNQWFFDPHIKNAYSEQWNFGVQRQLSGSLALRVDYVGSTTHRANVGGLYNTALTPGPGNAQDRAPYPYGIPTFYDHSVGTGSYNALQVQLDKRYTSGFSYQIAYTWAKSLTVDDGFFGIEGQVPQDPYNPQKSLGPSSTNIPNLFVANGLYAVPVGHGQRFSTGNRFGDYILGNWQINNIFTWRNGQNFTVLYEYDQANTGNSGNYERANVVGNIQRNPHTKAEWFNTAAYAVPAQYTYGNGGTNTQQEQRWINLDTSIIRSFPIWREKQFQFRAEAFNLFNHPIFGQPGNDLHNPNSFGAIGTSQANTNRQLQFSGKIIF